MAAVGKSNYFFKGKILYTNYDFSCLPCSKKGDNVEAIKFCLDCDSSLCSMCLKFHNSFENMRAHQLLDQAPTTSRGQQKSTFLPNEKCLIHHGKAIDMYCGTHDVVCCTACIAVSHRSCEDVDYIPQAVDSLRQGQEVSDVKLAVNKVRSDIEKLKITRQEDLMIFDKQKISILNQIKSFRKRINKHLDRIEKNTRDEFCSIEYQNYAEQINADLKSIGELSSQLKKNAKDLKTFDSGDKPQMFISVKQSKVNAKEAGALVEAISERSAAKLAFKFVINKTITDTICNSTSLGTFQKCTHNQYNIRVTTDKLRCHITGSCLLEDGSIVISDYNNGKIKKLDRTYKVVAQCDLPCRPHSVCSLGPAEVAISLYDIKNIQFATVTDSISLTKSFPVGDRPRGLAYSDDKLLVLCGGWEEKNEGPCRVDIYDTAGTLLRSLTNDESTGNPVFSVAIRVSVSLNGKKMHIADRDNGVMTFDKHGYRQHLFTDPELTAPLGVCVTGDDSLLVAGCVSNNVVQIDSSSGQKKAVLLTHKDGIRSPMALCYDMANARLIVSMVATDHINVYELPA